MTKDRLQSINEDLAKHGAWLTWRTRGDGRRLYILADGDDWAKRYGGTNAEDILSGKVPPPNPYGVRRLAVGVGETCAEEVVAAFMAGVELTLGRNNAQPA